MRTPSVPALNAVHCGLCLCKCKCDLYSRITLNKEVKQPSCLCIFIGRKEGRETKTKLTVCFLVLVCDSHKNIYIVFKSIYNLYIIGRTEKEIRKKNK